VASAGVATAVALRSQQFWLLWFALACNCTGGAAVLASAKIIMTDTFMSAYPTVVTGTFAAGFVGMLAVANAVGRIGWAAASDTLGRKKTLFLCSSLAAPACLVLPQLAPLAIAGKAGLAPLAVFCSTSFMIVSCYGGAIALMPSYCCDLFGSRDSGVIYGWAMTGWSAAAVVGPSILAVLRERSYQQAIDGLMLHVSPACFEKAFCAPLTELPALLSSKTVTISRLLEIAPLGTTDPTPFLYDSTFYTMGGILATAAVSNALINKIELIDKDVDVPNDKH